MRVEIVQDYEGTKPRPIFPPDESYSNLAEEPHPSIEGIAIARQHHSQDRASHLPLYRPLKDLLAAVNSGEGPFVISDATARCEPAPEKTPGKLYRFSSEKRLVFAESSFGLECYMELGSSLKELLERDPSSSVRAVLRIAPCEFSAGNRNGFCLTIELTADGDTAQQAELRWGLGMVRLQQALLFRARTLRQQAGVSDL